MRAGETMAVALMLALAGCGGPTKADLRVVAETCEARGGSPATCTCFSQELSKRLGKKMFSRAAEHARAVAGDRQAKKLEGEDQRRARTLSQEVGEMCLKREAGKQSGRDGSRVNRSNADTILGDYLMKECLRTGMGERVCQCQLDDFMRSVKPETRLVLAHTAAGDNVREYPMTQAQAVEVSVATNVAVRRCGI